MRIVIPVSHFDDHLLDTSISLFRALGGMPNQDVVFLPTRSMATKAKIACESIAPYCRKASVIEWEKENSEPQPMAGNLMWQHAVIQMGKLENAGDLQPWFFWELDCTAKCRGFADKLESDYFVSGCQFMGAIAPSRVKLGDGTITTEVNIPGLPPNPPFMVGAGIYPVNVPLLTKGQWAYAKFEPWDKFLRFYTARSLHGTKLIQHQWKTCNFRDVDGAIICDNDPSNPDKTDNTGPQDPAAVVHHGCKDGSLARLILESLGSASVAPLPSTPAPQAPEVPAAKVHKVSYDKTAFSALQRSVEENKSIEQARSEPLKEAAREAARELAQSSPKPADESPDNPEIEAMTKEAIAEALKGKSMRLPQLAGVLGMEASVLEEMLLGLGYTCETGLKWVKPVSQLKVVARAVAKKKLAKA